MSSATDTKEPASAGLVSLAEAHGLQPTYVGQSGEQVRVPATTLVRLLRSLGIDASSPAQIEAARQHREDEAWLRVLPGTVVVRSGWDRDIEVHVDHGQAVTVRVELEAAGGAVELDQLDVWVPPRSVEGIERGRATFRVPGTLPLGYHEIIARVPGRPESRGTLIVVPHRAPEVAQRSWGLVLQLYSVRSVRSWGVGDFTDLSDLALIARRCGAGFMLTNPLHASEPVAPLTPSPYLPTSRAFVAPWYVRVEDVPEAAYLSGRDRARIDELGGPARALNGDASRIDRDLAWTAKREALRLVYHVPRSAVREADYRDFCRDGGQELEDFALWCVLVEEFGPGPWPPGYEHPQAPETQRARVERAPEIDFVRWTQWVAARQLQAAQQTARAAGMPVGLMADLAVGSHPQGADVWAQQHLLALDVAVGAPPDMYNQVGQSWSMRPWRPDALARDGFRSFRTMLHRVFQGCGAVRIDHVLGLFRQWWVPDGSGPAAGAYITCDHDALVGILCLEAQRAGVVVIGEDLGTVEPWVSEYLASRGILGTTIALFEKEGDGTPRPPEQYRTAALTTVTTHDLPPTAGYLEGEHVEIRERLGLLTTAVEEERASARSEHAQLVDVLRGRGLVGAEPDVPHIVEGMHAFVAQTPSTLLGVALVDAVGEHRAQNQPGTDTEYPNWLVPLADAEGAPVWLDTLIEHQGLRQLARLMNRALNA